MAKASLLEKVILFDADGQSKVNTARSVGIDAHVYESVAQVEAVVTRGRFTCPA